MPDPIWMTRCTYDKLQQRLETLQKTKSSLAAELLATLQQGAESFHDNFPWEDATRRRSHLEGELIEIKVILGNCQFIDDLSIDISKVGIGTKVTLDDGEDEFSYTILGPLDSSPEKDIISYQSPIGEILMGKKVGQVVQFREVKLRIVKIEKWQPEKEEEREEKQRLD